MVSLILIILVDNFTWFFVVFHILNLHRVHVKINSKYTISKQTATSFTNLFTEFQISTKRT